MMTSEESGPKHKSGLVRVIIWVLKGVLFLGALLIPLFVLDYIYEDWSGSRAWAKGKTEIEAAGISLDPQTYIPAPVPDTENFAALPVFQLEPDPKHPQLPRPLALEKALSPINGNIAYDYQPGKLPYFKDVPVDMKVVRQQFADFCRKTVPPIQVPENASASEILGLICPALADLRKNNATHPYCRLNLDYTKSWQNLEPLQGQLGLAKALSYEEKVAVLDGQGQLVLDDLNVGWKLASGLQKEPLLISGLINMGVVAIHLAVVDQALARHVWNDQQLAELDANLGGIDFVAESQLCLRGDFVVEWIPLIARSKADRFFWLKESQEVAEASDQPLTDSFYWQTWIKAWLTSNGDWDRYLASYKPLLLPGEMQLIDLPSRRVFPEKEASYGPNPSEVTSTWLPSLKRFSYAQVQIDEARIACRLERYRLAHGAYPDSLNALLPTYGPDLPHDIVNGEPYHYKLNADGTFLLYSEGWNQKDDGGSSSVLQSLESPDWVWANNSVEPKTK